MNVFRMIVAALLLVVCSLASSTTAAQGTLYMVDEENLWIVDYQTASKSLVGPGQCDALAPSPQPTDFLYCAVSLEKGGNLYSLDLGGGGLTWLALIDGDGDRGLAYNSANGVIYGADNVSFGSINPVTGDFTRLADPPPEPEALAADPNRNLVYALDESKNLIAYDIDLDVWLNLGLTGVGSEGKAGMAYDPLGDYIYFMETGGDLYRINPVNGFTELVGTVDGVDSFTGLAFVPLQESEVVPSAAVPSTTFLGSLALILLVGFAGLYLLRVRHAKH
jgi:DNA-binding beta-propeller fold protein YncE